MLTSVDVDEDYYERANAFVPERWYSQPEMIKHKNAWAPFSLGTENCIGKNCEYHDPRTLSGASCADVSAVAMTELRTLSALLLLNYDVSLAEGEDGTRLLTMTKDHFTLGLGGLDLVFTPVKA